MMKKSMGSLLLLLIVSLVLVVLSAEANATMQMRDKIMVDGELSYIDEEPLAPILGLLSDPRASSNEPRMFIGPGRCSANWRGYVAQWVVRGDRLLLDRIDVDPCSRDGPRELRPASIFPSKTEPGPAYWFTGILTVPRGKPIGEVIPLLPPRFEKYLILHIKEGVVMSRELKAKPY